MALVWFFKVDTQETCSKTKLTKSRKFYSIPPRGNRDILSSSWISTNRQTKRPGPRGDPTEALESNKIQNQKLKKPGPISTNLSFFELCLGQAKLKPVSFLKQTNHTNRGN